MGYAVLEQDNASDLKSEANASSYPKGELSCICDTPSMQSEQFNTVDFYTPLNNNQILILNSKKV
jgi:hypothetical protein